MHRLKKRKYRPMPHSFDTLGLCHELHQAAQRFAAPTAVQVAVIPLVLRGGDVLCTAPTGEGKTAAFALPLLSLLVENPSSKAPRPVRVLVLAPTRELVAQIEAEFEGFARYAPKPIKVKAVYGGVAVNPQMMALRGGADVLVATPGRLLDLVAQNAVKLSDVCTLVLDEAEKLAGGAFADELTTIMALLPVDRQTLWFSATLADNDDFTSALLIRHDVVNVAASNAVDGNTRHALALITQRAIAVDASARTQLLRHLIIQNNWQQVLVFVATKHAADVVTVKLNKTYPSAPPIVAAAFHADLAQMRRSSVLNAFKAGSIQVMVATDVAARGLHIDHLPVVVNFDLPRSPSDYTHRIGRTGRAGQAGLAVSFVSVATQAHFELIQKRQGLSLELEVVAGFEPLEKELPPLTASFDMNGGVKGKRPSKKDKLRVAALAG
jgi:ATP-dependent RNA helicase RhlE